MIHSKAKGAIRLNKFNFDYTLKEQTKRAAKAYLGKEDFEATKPIEPDLETTKRSNIERLKNIPKSNSVSPTSDTGKFIEGEQHDGQEVSPFGKSLRSLRSKKSNHLS